MLRAAQNTKIWAQQLLLSCMDWPADLIVHKPRYDAEATSAPSATSAICCSMRAARCSCTAGSVPQVAASASSASHCRLQAGTAHRGARQGG